MNSLGFYFGPKIISAVETKGISLLRKIQIAQSAISGSDLEEKVPEEIKLVSLLNDELNKNKIAAKEAVIAVSGKDLIIRTFDMPFIPQEELYNAVNFEAKKYVPFKIEDLISDFQVQRDKASRKNFILFVGIKKETLEKYLLILSQLNIKVSSLEYSAFSVLRLIKLANIRTKGIIAVVDSDLKEEDEANFIVLKDGFPLFSRDINLVSDTRLESFKLQASDLSLMLEKLKGELRISLDFYRRKFPSQDIEKVIFLSGEEYHAELESFVKERGLATQFVDLKKITKIEDCPLSCLKAFGSCLGKASPGGIRIDFFKAKQKPAGLKEAVFIKSKFPSSLALPIDAKIVLLAIVISFAPYFFGSYQKLPFRKELSEITSKMIKIPKVSPDVNYEGLKSMTAEYRKKIEAIAVVFKKQVYLTEVLDSLPRSLPNGVLLNSINYSGEGDNLASVNLEGYVITGSRDEALELINALYSNLISNPVFIKYFKNTQIQSVKQDTTKDNQIISNFFISAKSR